MDNLFIKRLSVMYSYNLVWPSLQTLSTTKRQNYVIYYIILKRTWTVPVYLTKQE